MAIEASRLPRPTPITSHELRRLVRVSTGLPDRRLLLDQRRRPRPGPDRRTVDRTTPDTLAARLRDGV